MTGSTDNSPKMCDDFAIKDTRIKVIHKKNGGLSDARNFGIREATGDYIQFIDGDDYIELDTIEVLYNGIKENNCDISMCSYYILKNSKTASDATYQTYFFNREEILQEILLDERVRCYAWNKLFKSKLLENITFPYGKVFEDILTIPKIFEKANSIVWVDIPKYYYRQREGSILHNQTDELRLSYINAALEINAYLLKKEEKLEKYCKYNVIHIAIKTFNDIGFFNMKQLEKNEIVLDLYNKSKELFLDVEIEKFIIEKSNYVKKLHLYYLISDKEGYIKNNRKLPVIYAEYNDMK